MIKDRIPKNSEALSIALVTNEVAGPHRNGGIGTFCYTIARFLAKELGHEVTLLYTWPFESHREAWITHFREVLGVETVMLPLEDLPPTEDYLIQGRHSLAVYRWLRERYFDLCLFQDWQPDGFHSIQAKRTGQAFARTALAAVQHSSNQWLREGLRQYNTDGLREFHQDYMTRYCAEHADFVVSPSQSMLDWCRDKGWALAEAQRVLRFPPAQQAERPAQTAFGRKHLIFFGRLETRKGLDLYLRALQRLEQNSPASATQLRFTFLGRDGAAETGGGIDAIHTFFRKHSSLNRPEVLTDFNQQAALNYLREHRDALVVVPSLQDNLPFTVFECLDLGLNIIASRVGGIPDLVDNTEALFEPTPAALCEKLQSVLIDGAPKVGLAFTRSDVTRQWQAFLQEAHAVAKATPASKTAEVQVEEALPISVCVAHFNHGTYLPRALASLAAQKHPDFEVIVTDDGSTDTLSREVFAAEAKRYAHLGWTFLTKENRHLSHTRNYCAQHARHDTIAFFDSDNYARPEWLLRYARALEHDAGLQAVSCHVSWFVHKDNAAEDDLTPSFLYVPIGPCLELGLHRNCFGDACFAMRKTTFFEVGGFNETPMLTSEDWGLLARVALAGHAIDVVPETLVDYRHDPASVSRNSNLYQSHILKALEGYLKDRPAWEQRHLHYSVGNEIIKGIIWQELKAMEHGVKRLRNPLFAASMLLRDIKFRWRKRHHKHEDVSAPPS